MNKEEIFNLIKKILMTAMIFLLLVTTGCDQQNPSEEQKNPPEKISQPIESENKNPPKEKISQPVEEENKNSQKNQQKTLQVKIYYPDDSGINLVAVDRKIKFAKDDEKYFETAKLLTKKPTEKDLTKIFPNNAKINGVILKRDTIFVNFDNSVVKNFVGGSTGEEMLINSFVQTLTEFPEVKQVKFLVDGKDVETLSGHMDLSLPIKRTEE